MATVGHNSTCCHPSLQEVKGGRASIQGLTGVHLGTSFQNYKQYKMLARSVSSEYLTRPRGSTSDKVGPLGGNQLTEGFSSSPGRLPKSCLGSSYNGLLTRVKGPQGGSYSFVWPNFKSHTLELRVMVRTWDLGNGEVGVEESATTWDGLYSYTISLYNMVGRVSSFQCWGTKQEPNSKGGKSHWWPFLDTRYPKLFNRWYPENKVTQWGTKEELNPFIVHIYKSELHWD